MLTISKMNGASSNTGQIKRGNRGRLELWAERTEDGYRVRFADYGSYGRSRWQADFGLVDEDQLRAVIGDLEALLDGVEDSTHVAFVEPVAEPVEEPEVEAVAAEPEEETEPVVDPEIVSEDESFGIEQLEA
jgi:hypothetical protein